MSSVAKKRRKRADRFRKMLSHVEWLKLSTGNMMRVNHVKPEYEEQFKEENEMYWLLDPSPDECRKHPYE